MIRTLRIIILFGLLALGACAGGRGVPVPPACRAAQPAEPPAGAAAAMVEIARGQWRDWGSRVLRLEPDAAVLTLPGAQFFEHEPQAYGRLAAYWCATPPHVNYWANAARAAAGAPVETKAGDLADDAYRALPIGRSPFYLPWSAAFTSWVVWSAGVKPGRFDFSDAHWDYVADIMRAAPGTRDFAAHDYRSYAPRPGDMLCETRAEPALDDWRRLLDHSRPMHCDVVAGARACPESPAGRCLEAIGGNVLQAVTMTIVPLDPRGLVQRVPLSDGSGRSRRDWIVVLENLRRP